MAQYQAEEVVNLTPHEVRYYKEGGEVVRFAPSGVVPRCDEMGEHVWPYRQTKVLGGVLTRIVRYGSVDNLPDAVEGRYLIVSALIKAALPGRPDLISPIVLVRDEAGRVIGCKAFARCNQGYHW